MIDGPNFHAAIISRVGGKAELARALGLKPTVVTKWHVRGIPPLYWSDVAAMPRAEVTVDELKKTRPSTSP